MWRQPDKHGWIAAVAARVLVKDATARKSAGFCGYEWMVESIVGYGRILSSEQIAALKTARSA